MREFFVDGDCTVLNCKFGGIHSLYPLLASSTIPLPPVMTTKKF